MEEIDPLRIQSPDAELQHLGTRVLTLYHIGFKDPLIMSLMFFYRYVSRRLSPDPYNFHADPPTAVGTD